MDSCVSVLLSWCFCYDLLPKKVVECISESLCIEETPLPLKVARLYLVNDILQNCIAHVPNASFYRRGQVLAFLAHVCVCL